MKRLVSISSEVDLLFSNGFYYVAIPECVDPDPYECCGRCVALDPGLKAFMTGVDLEGNKLEFGRDNKLRLNEVRYRASAVQHVMSKFKNRKAKSKRWDYRPYAKAKRTFTSCVAKLKNLVKDLHYKTRAYLTEHYDAILLPIFKTKDMIRRSSARTHGSNTSILSLNHFKFRQLLQAKCTVKGKSPVVCSEMYTIRTWGGGYTQGLGPPPTPLSISCAMCALDRCKSSSESCTTFSPDKQRASRTRAAAMS
jgi:transposase